MNGSRVGVRGSEDLGHFAFNINFDLQMHAILVGDRLDNSIKYT